ncbi:hypothetical protein V1358_06315 [Pseudoalteromonas sp. YIC-656]|uniref:hypothetical protein n=1 Tax=Pseudoalteromonas pernae TaxID=3118054 RepID=UPI0032421A28
MKAPNIIIGILATTTLGGGWAALSSIEANDKNKVEYIAISEENSRLDEELQAIKAELLASQQESKSQKALIASLNTEISALKSLSTSSVDTTSPLLKRTPKETQVADVEKVTELSDTDALLALAKKIKKGESIADIEENFRTRFNKEAIDDYWAYDYENNIRDMIAADANNRFEIQELQCKTNACELKITATQSNAMLLGTQFSKTIGEMPWRDESATVIFNHDVKDEVMSILVGRDKHSFK